MKLCRFRAERALPRAVILLAVTSASVWTLTGEVTGARQGAESYSLAQCLAEALDGNRDLEGARLGLDVARKQVHEAWGGVFPTLDASASFTRNLTADESLIPAILFDPTAAPEDRIAVKFTADNLWNTTVTLDQPLFQAEVLIGIGAAERYRQLREEEVRGAAQRVVTEVRGAYYGVLIARENARLTEESLRRVRQTLAETQAMNRAGLASDYDVLRLEVELANLEPGLRRARNELAAAERALSISMGRDAASSISIVGSLRTMDLSRVEANESANAELLRVTGVQVEGPHDQDRLLEIARARRSDLRQARLTGRLARTQLSAERAGLFPRLSAFASYRLNAQEDGGPDFFGESESQRTANWQAGVRLEIPLFQGGQRYSRIAQRRISVRRRDTEERLLLERADDEVRTHLDSLIEARKRAEAQARAVLQARRGFEIASAQYREGLGSQLQVTDAEVALRSSEFNYARAVFDVLQDQAALDAAVGMVPTVDDTAEEE